MHLKESFMKPLCSNEGHWHCRKLLSCRAMGGLLGCHSRAFEWGGRLDFISCSQAVWKSLS